MKKKFDRKFRFLVRIVEDDLLELSQRLEIFKELFYKSTEDTKKLYEVDGVIFDTFRRVMAENLTVFISRLTDPAKMGKKKNITLETVLNFCEESGDEQFFTIIKPEYDKLYAKVQPIRNRRNKTLAHKDHKTSILPDQHYLMKVSPNLLDEVFKLMSEFMNKINGHFWNRSLSYNRWSERHVRRLVSMIGSSDYKNTG